MKLRIVLFLLLGSTQVWAGNQCLNLFADHQLLLDRKSLVEQDLSSIYLAEATDKTPAEVADMNLKTLASIQQEVPFRATSTRAVEISEVAADKLVDLTYENPIVNPGSKKYDPNRNIGFCFGRATFIHLMLLKMGVQKNSIRKIWAIGPMKTGDINWRYHVATMVYTKKGWLVLDTNHGGPVSPQEWIATYSKMSIDGKLRFYSSDASKFAFMIGKYSRLQLGMDINQERDFYRGYFKDMMEWIRKRKLSEDGMVSVDKEVSEKQSVLNMTMSDMWRSIVEFLR
ncbi:MAG: protein-glutamine glutaminase family protein [Pseudobdellovibrio sp.]|nr:protein-glutamine glutaminase family protein [Pseudobdellovibrio sp.]